MSFILVDQDWISDVSIKNTIINTKSVFIILAVTSEE